MIDRETEKQTVRSFALHFDFLLLIAAAIVLMTETHMGL